MKQPQSSEQDRRVGVRDGLVLTDLSLVAEANVLVEATRRSAEKRRRACTCGVLHMEATDCAASERSSSERGSSRNLAPGKGEGLSNEDGATAEEGRGAQEEPAPLREWHLRIIYTYEFLRNILSIFRQNIEMSEKFFQKLFSSFYLY